MSASRKYQRYFNPVSRAAFSTSGTVRAQGRVGQTSLSRSNTTTPFKGVDPVGNGGSGGNYVRNIVLSCNKSSPSNGKTTMTSQGYILSRVLHPIDNECGAVQTVKDYSPENASQSMRLKQNNAIMMQTCGPELTGRITRASNDRKPTSSPYTKRVHALSSSEYTRTQYLHHLLYNISQKNR
jgi:hypothetical protein